MLDEIVAHVQNMDTVQKIFISVTCIVCLFGLYVIIQDTYNRIRSYFETR